MLGTLGMLGMLQALGTLGTLCLIKCFDHHIQSLGEQLEHMLAARSWEHLFPAR